ncbi:MAG: hypothetical protein HFF16_01115 [Angelakisella sp.]|nr:hypothetical protein [Angelakisella sp.]
MKKSSFMAMMFGTVSGMLFALGMCMVMIPEWGAFRPGVVLGCVGLTLGLITILVWRRMEHKEPVRLSGRALLLVLFGVIGALALGVGMCYCMVWNSMVKGIVIGLGGILALLCLVPLGKGIREE